MLDVLVDSSSCMPAEQIYVYFILDLVANSQSSEYEVCVSSNGFSIRHTENIDYKLMEITAIIVTTFNDTKKCRHFLF